MANETRIPIVLLDTGVDSLSNPALCTEWHKDFTHTTLIDRLRHGEIILEIASRGVNIDKYCFVMVKFTNSRDNSYFDFEEIYKHIETIPNVSVLNMSLSGPAYSVLELEYLRIFTKSGTRVVVAAGNDSKNLDNDCDAYPACYTIESKRFIVVSGYSAVSNRGSVVKKYFKDLYDKQRGSSIAAAMMTNELLK